MRKRSVVAAATLAGMMLAACSSTNGSGNSSSTSAPNSPASSSTASWPAPTTNLKGTTLTFWAAQSSNNEPKKVIADFEAATDAKVNVVTIPDPYEQGVQTKIASGDKPDLAFWQPTASELTSINAAQNLQPLTGAPWISNFQPALQNITGLLDGTRYAALVTSPTVMGVYYNKQVFAKYGISSLPTNFNDMVSDAKQIKAKGGTPFYEMGADRWATQWWVQVQLADAAKAGAAVAKKGQPQILVMPKLSRNWLDDSECVDGSKMRVETYLTHDVVPAVDAQLRTKADRADRVVGGMSAGGYCALNLGLRNRNTFGEIVDMSGFTHPTHSGGMTRLFGHRPDLTTVVAANSPDVYAADLPPSPATSIYLLCGTGDHAAMRQMAAVRDELRSRGFDVSWNTRPGGHTYGVWRPGLAAALAWSGAHAA